MDKAARAALLTAKGMDKTSENIADYVADLLRQGRAKEITDDLMEQADPQRLMHHYTTGNTGMDMPMDKASRMARAAQMGFDTKSYHGTHADFPAFDNRAYAASNYGTHSGEKDAADIILQNAQPRYAKNRGAPDYADNAAVLPLMAKTKNNLRIEDTGEWEPDEVLATMAWNDNPDTKNMYYSIVNDASYPNFGADAEKTKFISDSMSKSGHTGFTYNNEYEGGGDSYATLDPTNIRSQFARFDPRLDHLAHLSASTGGAMDFARHVEAVQRAGGQIAPSKYLPNVPRQVHAGGGKVAFQEGNHPLVPPVVYHGTQSDIKTFRQSQTGEFGPGIYMTDLPEEAADYAGTHPFAGKGPNVMPLHLSMKNPFVVKSDPQEFWEKFGGKWDEDAQKNAIAAGHDGVIFRRPYMKWDDSLKREVPTGKHHTHFVAFNPTQVKSAISAQNFDPNDPDITKAEGGSVTDTDEFRNWFGNSVTHTDGDPHVFYTGTSKDKDFTSFNVGRHGAWFTRDPALASQYAEQNDSQGYKQDGWKLTPINTASRVIPAYVKAENPYTGDLPDEVLRSNYKAAQSDWFDTLRRKGHDAWIPARHNGDLVVALKEPQQIKSIFNNGKFDPNQKHMNKAGGGEVDDDGITAYHGSPHSFDSFDIANLGTGEGAQAYGHGLYFAGNEGVAKAYRNQLSGDNIEARNYFKDEKILPNIGEAWQSAHDAAKAAANIPPDHVRAIATQVQNWISQGKKPETFLRYNQPPRGYEAAYKAAADAWSGVSYKKNKGHMYKVKLNVKSHELLDWDKPLSEQPEVARKLGYASHEDIEQRRNALQSKMRPIDMDKFYEPETHVLTPEEEQAHTDAGPPLEHWGNMTGKNLHDRLVAHTGSKKDAADAMQAAGLKGIKYRDAGSRDLSDGDPTHNYVMFHHDPVQVVDKYEYGGTVGKEEGGATGSLREKALWPSAQAIKAGTGSREAHAELVNKIKPVSPYEAPVAPASDQQVHDALTKDKQPKAFAPRALGEGTPVAVRLDIPAYEKRNTWVVSVHHPKSDFTAGEVIGYDSVAHIGNPRFGVHPTGALNIASGKPKATIATVHGNWKKTTPEDAFKLSQTVHNDPQWRQVGMDPERHSYFYDRETQEPVMAADEALHIGPLVYAKNPVYGKKTDFAFSKGGGVDSALALTRRFTKDGAGATMALKPKGK